MAQLRVETINAYAWNGVAPGSLSNVTLEFYLTPKGYHWNYMYRIYSVHFRWQSFGIAKTATAPADWNVTISLQKLRSKQLIAADRHYTVRRCELASGWDDGDETMNTEYQTEQWTEKFSGNPQWTFIKGVDGQGKLRLILEHGGSNNMATCNNNPRVDCYIEFDIVPVDDLMDFSNLEVQGQ